MMLPGTAMRDIMMHNIMSPLVNLFRSQRVERAAVDERWSREERRHWWRSLGGLARAKREEEEEEKHMTLSRRKRTVGLYSYAPWLTNDVS